jgi:hypothetical protein
MAISESLILKKLSGHLGKEIVFKQYGDKTVVTKYPNMSNRVLSPAQLRINAMMREANYKAKGILANEALRNEAQVRLNTTRNKLYTALIREYFGDVLKEKMTGSVNEENKKGPDGPQ